MDDNLVVWDSTRLYIWSTAKARAIVDFCWVIAFKSFAMSFSLSGHRRGPPILFHIFSDYSSFSTTSLMTSSHLLKHCPHLSSVFSAGFRSIISCKAARMTSSSLSSVWILTMCSLYLWQLQCNWQSSRSVAEQQLCLQLRKRFCHLRSSKGRFGSISSENKGILGELWGEWQSNPYRMMVLWWGWSGSCEMSNVSVVHTALYLSNPSSYYSTDRWIWAPSASGYWWRISQPFNINFILEILFHPRLERSSEKRTKEGKRVTAPLTWLVFHGQSNCFSSPSRTSFQCLKLSNSRLNLLPVG
jgi:hypothetical protein